MTPLADYFQRSLKYLQEKGISSPRRLLEDFLTSRLQIDRLSLYTDKERSIDDGALRRDLERLADGEPLAYVLGSVPFFGCELKVTRDVLIPRQETELMVAWILKILKKKSGVLVDLCTGSGCLGIALKRHLPSFQVILIDISQKALSVAEENAKLNNVEVRLLQGDLLAPLLGQKIDLLVSNPPYVTEEEYRHLDSSVKDYEPKLALVGGEDGLLFYRRIYHDLPPLMNSGGELFLEIGSSQGGAVSSLFSPPIWKETIVECDLASHPRFVHTLLAP